ncbi:P-loop containing nucleoside triphosphate hydrolase protein [Laetiporus sulphureus 93-53]|uniref:p-loop containing nucleoside triphosphate hydrolase protein n=1 Tax=Laetiporus sulphureus 93-53 TaxID=1314785 RepID=A0A165F2F2_9APHY|nr:P-loop containing nucleoside triphosphate hydrolase protein [Laetiporus sulphureus 93-53]KZT08231.1 P-loop containing nucleoside triphosphate hydrolase protein [Laetiporus sulphureus 93-53]
MFDPFGDGVMPNPGPPLFQVPPPTFNRATTGRVGRERFNVSNHHAHAQSLDGNPAITGQVVDNVPSSEGIVQEDIPDGPPGSILEAKQLHEVFDPLKRIYVIKPAPPETVSDVRRVDTKYGVYAFTVIRRFEPINGNVKSYNVTVSLEIHSEQLIQVAKEVMEQIQGISWNAKPLRMNPETFLAWLPELQTCQAKLITAADAAPDDDSIHLKVAHLSHLLTYLTETYASTLDTLSHWLRHGEITFDLLWALYVPRKAILYTLCPVTGEPRAVRLQHAELCKKTMRGVNSARNPTSLRVGNNDDGQHGEYLWRLKVEYVEADVPEPGGQADSVNKFGYADLGTMLEIQGFTGARKISSLHVYPIKYYAGPGGVEGLKERLTKRGRRWAAIAGGMHHLAYRGMAWLFVGTSYGKLSVKSRVMIDRKTFAESMPGYTKLPKVLKTLSGSDIDRYALNADLAASGTQQWTTEVNDLSEEELLLTTPIVYGFSLSDKSWFEFAIDHVETFEWNDGVFSQLVIPDQHKTILRTLVGSYNAGAASGFDDFVNGKGLGLVVNLFGSPGIGKTLTAEAITEYLRKPLYIVGAGELGTVPQVLESKLSNVLKLSAAWDAVVLIDEADVFLEQRSLHNLERNAMVAVFLRQLEYFRGILFLTTNRVRVFDEAFQSRIHVSLKYTDLTPDARRQIWKAFMRKVNVDLADGGLIREELSDLGERKVNGRQIKNVVKTAGALAAGQQEVLGYSHLTQVLELMEQFEMSCCFQRMMFG